MLTNLLIYRFAIFNALALTLLGYLTYHHGAHIFASDPTRISVAIMALFALTWFSTGIRVLKTSRAMNDLKRDGYISMGTDRSAEKRFIKIKHIEDCASWMTSLGILGTVIGFIMTLSGIDPNALASAQGVKTVMPLVMSGMNVALYTTLVGGFFGLWTEINYRILHTATTCLCEDSATGRKP